MRNSGRALLATMLCAVAGPAATTSVLAGPVEIVDIGDSYLSGYGVKPHDKGFVPQLQAALDTAGVNAKVVNTGNLGTSADALQWLTVYDTGRSALLDDPVSKAAILEIGGNDCSASLSLGDTRANLDGILRALVDKHVPVLVVGSGADAACDADYARGFPGIYAELAATYDELLYPDFKNGVTGHSELLQGDGDHANAAGVGVIVAKMLPLVVKLVDEVPPP